MDRPIARGHPARKQPIGRVFQRQPDTPFEGRRSCRTQSPFSRQEFFSCSVRPLLSRFFIDPPADTTGRARGHGHRSITRRASRSAIRAVMTGCNSVIDIYGKWTSDHETARGNAFFHDPPANTTGRTRGSVDEITTAKSRGGWWRREHWGLDRSPGLISSLLLRPRIRREIRHASRRRDKSDAVNSQGAATGREHHTRHIKDTGDRAPGSCDADSRRARGRRIR